MATTDIDNTEEITNDSSLDCDVIDDGIEPGELPSANESAGDKVVNVLEDILGENGAQDDLQKELDASATKKVATPKAKRTKATPKRKSSGRKAKAAPKVTTPDAKKKENVEAPSTAATPTPNAEAAKSKAVKSVSSSVKKEKSNSPAIKSETKVEKTPKTKEKAATKTVTKSTEKPETKTAKHANSKDVKSEAPKSVKASKKVKKPVPAEEKPKKEVKKEEAPPVVEIKNVEEKHALKKKVEELEKKISVSETDKSKSKKEKTQKVQSNRKRKPSETSAKEQKVKKTKEQSKSKVEKKDEIAEELNIKEELMTQGDGGDMRVVDEMDGTQSENESHFSNASSFSHTFSHSGSFTGSFTGSFSGSLSLSSFSGSNTSLDHDSEELLQHKEFIDSLLKGARYFIVKSNNHENVTLSKAKGVWATPPANERKLNDAYRHSTNVILVYSVKESGHFQGFARLASESRHDGIPVPWVLPPGFDRRILGGTFKVDWLNRKEVSFADCNNLRNPWNENKEVKICRDGQELEPSVGEVLCRMFDNDMTIDLTRVARHLKQRKKLGDYFGHKREYHPRFRGGGRSWRGSRGDYRGSFRGGDRGSFRGGDRGRFSGRRGGYYNNRDDRGRGRYPDRGANRYHHGGGSYNDERGVSRGGRQNYYARSSERLSFSRSRSRSPNYRRSDRESRDRKHKDRVKEFLKNDRSKFGVRKETLLHGSYSDYVREFQRQKEQRGSSYYPSSSSNYHHHHHHHHGSSNRNQYDAKMAAEEFLRSRR